MARKIILNEVYKLAQMEWRKKDNTSVPVIYIDQSGSTDSTYENKEFLKGYNLSWLPGKVDYGGIGSSKAPHAWGWVLWKGYDDPKMAYIKKFAEEVGANETPREDNKDPRNAEEVLEDLDDIKDAILEYAAQGVYNKYEMDAIVKNIDAFKEALLKGINDPETAKQLAQLYFYQAELKKLGGWSYSGWNVLSAYVTLGRKMPTVLKAAKQWEKRGYHLRDGETPIVLSRPRDYIRPSKQQRAKIINEYLTREGVKKMSELSFDAKEELERDLRGYPDINGRYMTYIAYDQTQIEADGPDSQPLQSLEKFEEIQKKKMALWSDTTSEETEQDAKLIQACIKFGTSIGIKGYKEIEKSSNGPRGWADSEGYVSVQADKKNHGTLSTYIHETAHQIMHWPIVSQFDEKYKKYYKGRNILLTRELREQQAELTAFLVLSGFGYTNQQEHFVYLRNWGLQETNCSKVFDEVKKVADFIYQGMIKNLENGAQ